MMGLLFPVLGLQVSLRAQERVVLGEEFTSQFCQSCSYAGPALSRLLDVYPDTFAFVQIHFGDPYATAWGQDRWTFYGVQYTPTTVFNGTDLLPGAVSNIDQQYVIFRANHFLPERAKPTDVTMDLWAEPVSGQTYRAHITVGMESGGTAKAMRITVVQVLDHWPDTPSYSRNGFKQAAAPIDISLNPGGTTELQVDVTFDAESWGRQADIRLIAWAQSQDPGYPAEVYQAAIRLWPLIALPGDADGDGIADAADNCPQRYNPNQEDGDQDGVGDICDNCVAVVNAGQEDADEDGYGDVCDNCVLLHHHDQTDSDGDGLGDVCDSCPEVVAPGGVDAFGRALGTIDLDCDVDRFDVALFSGCFSGPAGTTPPAGCDPDHFLRADVDQDGDVDMDDLTPITLNLTGPLIGPAFFVGQATCASCHPSEHTSWMGTIHATAFDTLVAGGAGENELCFPCHSVGYGLPGGFVNLTTTPQLAHVQCENCHGPGSNHVSDPDNNPLERNLDASLCGVCHQSCHGLCGENHHPQYEQWQTSSHATALATLLASPDKEDACLECHATDYRLPDGALPTLTEAEFDVECVACHDPHGSPNPGQLRLAKRELCADCHTMGTLAPPEEPVQPQMEVLHGTGGFLLDGTPMAGPHTTHWYGIPEECAVCHVHEEPYGGPHQPVNSGHTFEPNMRACGPCHTEINATELVAELHLEMETRFAEIARYLTPGDPLYVDPTLLTPAERARYEFAVFNYSLINADRSFGSHNAPYARAVLAETEAFFGIPPWDEEAQDTPLPAHGPGAGEVRQ